MLLLVRLAVSPEQLSIAVCKTSTCRKFCPVAAAILPRAAVVSIIIVGVKGVTFSCGGAVVCSVAAVLYGISR